MNALRVGWAGCLLGTLLCTGAHAAQVCSPTVNLSVPATTEGLYVNLVTGVSGQTEASVPGFDIDLYASANSMPSDQLKFYWGTVTENAGVVSSGAAYAVLPGDTVIGPASLFSRLAFTGDTSAWQAGANGYLGVRLRNEGSANATNYGWMRLGSTAPLGFPLTIVSWCYEDSGGAITTPSADVLLKDGFE